MRDKIDDFNGRPWKDTVPEEGEDDEVDGGEHPRVDTALRLDPVVHHSIPVLPSQDLQGHTGTGSGTAMAEKSHPRNVPRDGGAHWGHQGQHHQVRDGIVSLWSGMGQPHPQCWGSFGCLNIRKKKI